MKNQDDWSFTIEPKSSLWRLNLREVWQYKDLIWLFVLRDIKSQYKQTILGPLWFLIGPIFTVFTYTLVFDQIAGISTDGLPSPIFYMAGIIMWNYFQTSFTGTSVTFTANSSIFGKVYFPRLVSPISLVLSNLFKFIIQFFTYILLIFFYSSQNKVKPEFDLIYLIPILILLLAALTLAFGIITSSLTTKYRDLNFFIGFGVTLLMYISPVIYPISAVPVEYRSIAELNPISPLLETFRFITTGKGLFSWAQLFYSSTVTIGLLVIGIILFNRIERTFIDTV